MAVNAGESFYNRKGSKLKLKIADEKLNSTAAIHLHMIDLAAANHTNRELELMLREKKPLAVFYDYTFHLPNEEIIPEHRFKTYVEEGRFVRGEHIFDLGYDEKLGHEAKLKYVLFALSSEAWRIPAFILLKSIFLKTGRNPEELERMESHLLGYTEAEVDAWCDRAYRTKRG